MTATDPRARSAFESLFRETDADAAVLMTFGDCDGEVVVCDVHSMGSLVNWTELRDRVPPAGFDHDCSDDAIGMRAGQWCLQAPLRHHFNRFSWFEEDVGMQAPWERCDAYRDLYEPNAFVQQCRAILVDSWSVVGWVGVFWRTPVRAEDRITSVADGLVPDLQRGIEQCRESRAEHRVLLDETGQLIAADPDATTLFELDGVRAATGRSPAVHRGYRLTSVDMDGENDATATLLLLDPLEAPRIEMKRALTALQLQVADAVVEGLTNGQVAKRVGVSVNTVKYHLKNIYSILGVSNRIELASL